MKHHRLLAAALVAAAAGAVRAEDSTSINGITIYGTVDMGIAYDTHGAPNSTIGSVSSFSVIQKQSNRANFGVTENGMAQSKIGIKGAEDLGGGWTGLFKLEGGISPSGGAITDGLKSLINNNGYTVAGNAAHPTAYNGFNSAGADSFRAGQPFNQAAYVGVSNDTYGTLTLGRQTTLETDLVGNYDPLRNSYAYSLIGFSGTAAGSGSTEDSRWDNSIKYLVSYGPAHAGIMYSPNGSIGARNNTDLGADIGFDEAGLSVDFVYTHTKDEVSASSLSASQVLAVQADGLSPSNTVAATLFDTTAYSLGAKYVIDDRFTVLGGVEYIEEKSPSSPVPNGTIDIGGYSLFVTNNAATFPGEKDLTYVWAGVRYQATPKLELATGYYYLHQNDYSGNNAADIKACAASKSSSPTCAGDEHVMSIYADYHFTRKFDVYAGLMYSRVLGGQDYGFVHSNNIAPSAGVRYSF